MVDVAPGTVVVYSDIGCPWAHLAVFRLLRARDALGLEGAVRIDHRCFALEIVNSRPTPKRTLDAEVPVVGALDPDACWQVWAEPEHTYPVTTLPALEAVQAAKEQSLAASEELDRALRVAFFGHSRCISMRSVVLDVAGTCPEVDVERLRQALDHGRCRHAVISQATGAVDRGVRGSPHVYLPDGTSAHNPGVEMHWQGEPGRGFPVVTADDPSTYSELLQRAAALVP